MTTSAPERALVCICCKVLLRPEQLTPNKSLLYKCSLYVYSVKVTVMTYSFTKITNFVVFMNRTMYYSYYDNILPIFNLFSI